MVIKHEAVDMEVTETTAAESNTNVNGNSSSVALTPPPSKRARHDPPLTTNTTATISTDSTTILQDTLSAVIGNLGSLNPDQLQTLAGMLSSINNNTNGNTKTWTCDRCPSVFYSESDYYKHITFSHETDCGICLKSFTSHSELETHVQLVHQLTTARTNSNSVMCLVCKIKFPSNTALNAHMVTHTQVFKCDICDELFSEHGNLEAHLNTFHEQHKPHGCHVCSEAFATASQLYKHISFKHDLDCTVCQQPFTSAADLKVHMGEEHVFECCACINEGNLKVFNSVEAYDIHLSHFHKGMKFYKCINCKKRFVSLGEFQIHVMEAHQPKTSTSPSKPAANTSPPADLKLPPDQQEVLNQLKDARITADMNARIAADVPAVRQKAASTSPTAVKDTIISSSRVECRICAADFTDVKYLLSHMVERHENVCVYCNTVCDKGDITDHVVSTHQRKCELCEMVFRAEYLILEHYNEHHPELTPTPCVKCEKQYITAAVLVAHLREAHHQALNLPAPPPKDKDQDMQVSSTYNCKHCQYDTNTLSDLQSHTKIKHNTRCNTCKKLFPTSRMLDLHNLTEHQLKCETCHQIFSVKLILRNHITTEHPEKNINPCWICDEHYESELELAKHVTEHLNTRKNYPSCNLCDTSFPFQRDLDEHMSKEHDKPFFSCDICTHCFVSESALHKHIEIYHENIVFFNCNKCSKKTLSKPELDRHILTFHKDDYDYTVCEICNEKFTNRSDYFKHVSFAHDTSSLEDGINKCNNCTASFATEAALSDHQLKSHQKNKLFVCKICGVKFTSYYRLGRHMKMVHKGTEFACDICNKSFHSTMALYRHQKTYHENELGVKICLTCGARLPNQALLQEHVTQHFSVSDLKCKQCNMTFNNIAALNDHNLFHQRQEYRCIDCGKSFSSQTDLKVHVSVDHVGMVMCQFCEEAFQDEVVLQTHVKLQHSACGSGNKHYRCTDCGETFSYSSELKVHVTLKHLGQTIAGDGTPKYNCIDCTESFTDKQALKAHIGSKHAGNLVCNNCYRVFPSQHDLADHTCQLGKTVECKQCAAQFKHKAELEEHMITHVSINVNEQYCTLCNQQFNSIKELETHDCKGKTTEQQVPSTTDLQALVESLSKQQPPTPPKLTAAPLKQTDMHVDNNDSIPRVFTSPQKHNIPSILSSLLGPLNTTPEALSEALAELPAAKISELISTLSSNQEIINSLAINPPKLPDSLVLEQKRVAPPTPPQVAPIPCPRCKNKFFTKQALASHLQTCAAPSTTPQTTQNKKPDLKLVHRQLFIAAQNIDVTILNIHQVETLIQVLASADGLKKVPQHKVVDLLDAIEKSVKIKEAKEKEARKQKAALRKLAASPSNSPAKHNTSLSNSLSNHPARNTPSPSLSLHSQTSSPIKSKQGKVSSAAGSPKPPSLTDCLPPEITAAILPAIKEEQTDLQLLAKICSSMGHCKVVLPEWLTNELTLALTRAIQILKHPDQTNKSTLNELKSIILSILGHSGSSEKSIRQGTMNVLKRNYKLSVLQETSTSFTDLELFVQYLLSSVLPTLEDLTPNLLTLPFILDLVLKNKVPTI